MLKTIIKKINEKKGFSREDNEYLFKMLENADEEEEKREIKELLVRGNKGLAVIAMNRMSIPRYMREDILQEALIGLFNAVETYDSKKKVHLQLMR